MIIASSGRDPSTDELHLDYTQTVIPPKKYLLPQREELLRFKMDGSQIEPTFDGRQTVVLGVHTCDVHAIQLLDKVFNTGFVDQHYRKRRENTLLIGVECLKPCSKHSFCKSTGTLAAKDGFDLHGTDLSTPDDAAETVEYAIDVGSDRGRALLDRHAETRPATEADYKRLNGVLAEKWPRFWYRLDFDVSELPSLLLVWIVHQRLPDVLLLQRAGRSGLRAVARQTHARMGFVPARRVCHGCGRAQFQIGARCAAAAPLPAQGPVSGRCLRAVGVCGLRALRASLPGEDQPGRYLQRAVSRARGCPPRRPQQPDLKVVPASPCRGRDVRMTHETSLQARLEESIYLPQPARIVSVQQMTALEKLFTLELQGDLSLGHEPGQFVEVSALGVGEAPISISSFPSLTH